jgi:hypothetical protein
MEPHNAPHDPLPGFDEEKVAQKFARRVEQYWAEHGHLNVHCCVERISEGRNHQAVYVIRSNLIRGLPPGVKAKAGIAVGSLHPSRL